MASRLTDGAPLLVAPSPEAARWKGRLCVLLLLLPLLIASPAISQSPETAAEPVAEAEGDEEATSIETDVDAGESDVPDRRRSMIHWNEFDGPYSTFRIGFGYLVEYNAFSQDEASEEQFEMSDGGDVRDSRLVFSGRLKTKRPISWCLGAMYDGNDK